MVHKHVDREKAPEPSAAPPKTRCLLTSIKHRALEIYSHHR